MHNSRPGGGHPGAQPEAAAAAHHPDIDLEIEEYRPLSRRRQLLVGLLGVGMALFVMWQVMRAPREIPPHLMPLFLGLPVAAQPGGQGASAAPEPARCAPGQTSACLGGTAAVFVVPAAAPPASAAPQGR